MTLNDLEPHKLRILVNLIICYFRLLFSHLYLPGDRTILGAISATIDYFSMNAVADRHRLAAYHNKQC